VAELPEGITLERNRDLGGRGRYVWVRRGLLCCIAVLPILALLNVFGQRPTTTSVESGIASVSVTAPGRLRGGLIFQVRVKVFARRAIKQLQIVFDEGWWESMSVNSIAPEPKEENSKNGHLELTYGSLDVGQSLVSRIYFQVNPTNVGKRREDVTVRDGNIPLLTVHRSLTIFP
jgi:hypothetical protein